MSAEIGKAMRLYVEAVEKRDKEMEELSAESKRLADIARETPQGSPERRAHVQQWYVIQSRRIGLGTSVGKRRAQLLRIIEKELRRDGR